MSGLGTSFRRGSTVARGLLGLVGVMALLTGCSCEGPAARDETVSDDGVPAIRVRLGSPEKRVAVSVQGPYRIVVGNEEVQGGGRLEPTTFWVEGGKVAFEGNPQTAPIVEVHPRDGIFTLVRGSGRDRRTDQYRGFLRLLARGRGRMLVVNVVDMESYVAGVVDKELLSGWHLETHKAQAVAARTYALVRRNRKVRSDYHVVDSTADQAYGGVATETETGWDAVQATRGIVGTWKPADGPHELLLMQYHSTCGGGTNSAEDVFGRRAQPPLAEGVACTYCAESPHYHWDKPVVLAKHELARRLRASGNDKLADVRNIERVEAGEVDDNGRVLKVRIVTEKRNYVMPANYWRRQMGASRVKSTMCTFENRPNEVVLRGGGYGHGVGMCQYGAEHLARRGMTGLQILRYYYPGIVLVRAY